MSLSFWSFFAVEPLVLLSALFPELAPYCYYLVSYASIKRRARNPERTFGKPDQKIGVIASGSANSKHQRGGGSMGSTYWPWGYPERRHCDNAGGILIMTSQVAQGVAHTFFYTDIVYAIIMGNLVQVGLLSFNGTGLSFF